MKKMKTMRLKLYILIYTKIKKTVLYRVETLFDKSFATAEKAVLQKNAQHYLTLVSNTM